MHRASRAPRSGRTRVIRIPANLHDKESVMLAFPRRAARLVGALTVALFAACSEPASVAAPHTASADRAARSATPVATVSWNEAARGMVKKYNTSAPATIRLFALLTVAQYNAIVDAE